MIIILALFLVSSSDRSARNHTARTVMHVRRGASLSSRAFHDGRTKPNQKPNTVRRFGYKGGRDTGVTSQAATGTDTSRNETATPPGRCAPLQPEEEGPATATSLSFGERELMTTKNILPLQIADLVYPLKKKLLLIWYLPGFRAATFSW